MAILATKRWSDVNYRIGYPYTGWHASYSFDVTGAANEEEARLAVEGQFGISIGSSHPLQPLLVANMPSVHEISPTLFRVTIEYLVPPGGVIPSQLNPLDYPPQIIWSPCSHSAPAAIDGDGNPIINTAGDYFDPSPNIERPSAMFQVYRNEPFFDPVKMSNYVGRINSDSFTFRGGAGGSAIAFNPYQVRLNSYRPTDKYFLAAKFVPVCYEFEMRHDVNIAGDGWDLVTANVGFRGWYQGPNGPTIGGFYDATGQPVSAPVDLDRNGVPLDPSITVGPQRATPIANPNAGQIANDMIEASDTGAILLHYFPYKDVPFANLL